MLRYQDGEWLHIVKEAGHINGITELTDGELLLFIQRMGWVRYRPNLSDLGSISGRVTREDGSPWPGVGIRVEDEEGRARSGATTAINGSFRAGVFPGSIRVSVVQGEGVNPVEFAVQAGESIKGIEFTPTGIGRGEAVFTTRLGGPDGNEQPMDNIEETSIAEKKVIIFTRWGIPSEEMDVSCKIYDGAERLVAQYDLANEHWSKYTAFEYAFDRSLDKPGKWRFEVYLDDEKEIEKTLMVLSEPRDPRRREMSGGKKSAFVGGGAEEIEVPLPDVTTLDDVGRMRPIGYFNKPREKLKLRRTDHPAYFYEVGHSRAISEDHIISVMVIPQEDGELLYVDQNNDEDLTNDGRPRFFPSKQNDFEIWLADRGRPEQKTGRLLQRVPQIRRYPLDHPFNRKLAENLGSFMDTKSGNIIPRHVEFLKKQYPDFTGEAGTYYFEVAINLRRGKVVVRGTDYEIGLWDRSGNGRYNDERDLLIIDLDRSGGLQSRVETPRVKHNDTELFSLNDVLPIGGEKLQNSRSFIPTGRGYALAERTRRQLFITKKNWPSECGKYEVDLRSPFTKPARFQPLFGRPVTNPSLVSKLTSNRCGVGLFC